jgi:hypothetical protein
MMITESLMGKKYVRSGHALTQGTIPIFAFGD